MAEHELNKIVDDDGEVFNLRDSTKQPVSDRVTDWGSTPSDTKYPSEKLVKDALDAKAPNVPSEVTIANGDKIVIADSSDSNKVARSSVSFDGSTTTTALTPKGTWETFSKLTLGTTSSTAAAGNHTHSNYVQTDKTSSQRVLGDLYGYFPSTRDTMVGFEYNCFINAKNRNILSFTQSGTGQLTTDQVWALFDGAMAPQYSSTGIDPADPYVLTITLNAYTGHTQAFVAFGWTCRYWWPTKFKVETYSSSTDWVTLCDYSNTAVNYTTLFIPFGSARVNPHTGTTISGSFTKFRITIYQGSTPDNNRWGISEMFYCHPEAYTCFSGLNVFSSGRLNTARQLAVSLSNTSTNTTFNGTADVTNIKTTGTLGVSNGGTGNTSVDTTPTENSTKMVTSGGIKTALDGKSNSAEGVYYVAGTTDYPAWVANHAYAVNDTVNYNNQIRICKTAHTSGSSYDSTKWNILGTPVLKGTISGVTALYTGLKIAYKWPCTGGSSSTYLNINGLGNVYIRRNDSNMTTHVPVNTVTFLAYDGTYWRWADYDSNTNNWVTTMGAYCDTAAATQAKTATSTNTVYTAGEAFLIRIVYANTYNGKITLNINSQGAKDIWINGAVSSSTNKTLPAGEHWCYYDGTVFHIWTDGTAQFTKLKASTFTGDLVGNAATATSATQDSDGNAINATYFKSSGNVTLVAGAATKIGTQNGTDVKLTLPTIPSGSQLVYDCGTGSTSATDFDNALAAFNAGKWVIIKKDGVVYHCVGTYNSGLRFKAFANESGLLKVRTLNWTSGSAPTAGTQLEASLSGHTHSQYLTSSDITGKMNTDGSNAAAQVNIIKDGDDVYVRVGEDSTKGIALSYDDSGSTPVMGIWTRWASGSGNGKYMCKCDTSGNCTFNGTSESARDAYHDYYVGGTGGGTAYWIKIGRVTSPASSGSDGGALTAIISSGFNTAGSDLSAQIIRLSIRSKGQSTNGVTIVGDNVTLGLKSAVDGGDARFAVHTVTDRTTSVDGIYDIYVEKKAWQHVDVLQLHNDNVAMTYNSNTTKAISDTTNMTIFSPTMPYAGSASTAAKVVWSAGEASTERPVGFANSGNSSAYSQGSNFNSEIVYDKDFMYKPSGSGNGASSLTVTNPKSSSGNESAFIAKADVAGSAIWLDSTATGGSHKRGLWAPASSVSGDSGKWILFNDYVNKSNNSGGWEFIGTSESAKELRIPYGSGSIYLQIGVSGNYLALGTNKADGVMVNYASNASTAAVGNMLAVANAAGTGVTQYYMRAIEYTSGGTTYIALTKNDGTSNVRVRSAENADGCDGWKFKVGSLGTATDTIYFIAGS